MSSEAMGQSLTAERWQRVKTLFADALDRPAAERDRFVADAAADDAQVRREVEQLLEAHAIEDEFIEQPAAEHLGWALNDTASVWTGRRIGPYRVIGEAGRGGLGVVLRAVRDDGEVEQQVAIKLLQTGVSTDALMTRFREERRILARLNHPHIAHFLDGGATAEGQPYLVMEFVEGEPIDEYCDRRGLGLDARLDLFRALCSAVHHVHQNLLVHGDIKAGNVLVTSDGRVKLLDFGIARLLDPAAGHTGRAVTLLLMTPDYASPEQIRGEPITTASDVFSLGALLYRLVTGTVPLAGTGRGPDATTAGRRSDPMPPSVAAARADDGHAVFARALKGDLDTIILKALKEDPQERFGSAEQLGDDLHRYLRGFPVEARPDSAWYRVRKFARRHAAATTATALAVVALTGGIAVALWQAHEARVERERAERHFETVRQLSATFLGDVYDAIARIPGSTGARKLLVDRSLEYLESLERDAPDSAALRRDLGMAWERLGDVQGAYLDPSLGDREQALTSYRRSMAIRAALVAERPTVQNRAELLRVQVSLGEALLGADRNDEAGAVLAAAVRNADVLLASNDAGPYRRKAASAYMNHGWLEWAAGRMNEGLASLQRARAVFETIAAEHPDDRQARRDVALVHGRIGQAYMEGSGQFEEALVHYRQTSNLLGALLQDVREDVELERMRTYAQVTIGHLYVRLGRPREALETLKPEIETLDRWRLADPADSVAPVALGAATNLVGESHVQLGEFEAALQDYAVSARYLTPELADSVADLRVLYGQMLAGTAQAQSGAARSMHGTLRTARMAEAQETARRALAVLEPLRTDGDVGREASRLIDGVHTVLDRADAG